MHNEDKYVRIQFRSKHSGEWLTEKWLSVNLTDIVSRLIEYMDYYKALGLEYSMEITDNPVPRAPASREKAKQAQEDMKS